MYYRLFAMFAHCFPGLCGVAVRFSYTNLIALEVHDAYNIVFLKFAFDVGEIEHGKDLSNYIQATKSRFGRGGCLLYTPAAADN